MAEASIIDGKAIAAALREEVGRQAADLRAAHGLIPGLATVLVGEDPASEVYVRNKGSQSEAAGMRSIHHALPDSTGQAELLDLVARLNADPAVHGILVQLPLPRQIEVAAVIDAIDPAKDVDGFHPVNLGLLTSGRDGLRPCTPRGCMMLLDSALDSLSGRHAVVVGRSNIVGKPLALMLLASDCTVTVAHSRTRDLAAVCREADILVAAVGRPRLIGDGWVKPGAVVIDVGINRIDAEGGKTRLVGDVDFDAARRVAAAITPVPGGVGPMTIACLLSNTVVAACRQNGIMPPGGA